MGTHELKHEMAQIEPDVRLHFVHAGEGARTVVLLHGFPQTWWAWRSTIPALAAAGFHVIAPDYRGAGQSSRPVGGYDKSTMAYDIHRLLYDHLALTGPVVLVGHDIGAMLAVAFAQTYPQETSHLVVVDSPLPGTKIFDRLRVDPRIWQFAFHAVRDIPEMLVAGRERPYLQAFFNARIFNAAAVGETDLDRYVSAYASPGGMRAGFELYRTFEQDAADARAVVARSGRLRMPVLAVGGAASTTGPFMEEMTRELAENVTGLRIPGAAHWVAEENAMAFNVSLQEFLSESMGEYPAQHKCG
jgi:pimeloyl-ACP methyl ester carboxylesterase